MSLITIETAREYQRRAVESRRRNRTEKEQVESQASPQGAASDEFLRMRVGRVRKQLSRLDDMLEQETDPSKLDRLASAQARLAEQERLLANRPLPGSRRPPPEKPARQKPDVADWIE